MKTKRIFLISLEALAIIGSVYSSLELANLIYAVMIVGSFIFRFTGPFWLVQLKILLGTYTALYWIIRIVLWILKLLSSLFIATLPSKKGIIEEKPATLSDLEVDEGIERNIKDDLES